MVPVYECLIQVEAAISDKTSLEEELEEVRAEMNKSSSDRGAAEQERINLQDTLRRSLAGAQTLQSEVEAVTQDNQRLRRELSALTRVLEASVLQKDPSASQRSMPGPEGSAQGDFQISEVLQQQAGGLRVENGALNAEIDGLKEENAGLRLELLALKEHMEGHSKHNTYGDSHASDSSEYKKRFEELRLEVMGHEEAAGMLKAETESLKQEVLELRSQAASSALHQENEILKSELVGLREENQGLQVFPASPVLTPADTTMAKHSNKLKK